MKKEEFIEVLKRKNYLYEIQGDKIIVTHDGSVNLGSLETLPPGVEFMNRGSVYLWSLKTLPPGVEFKNGGYVNLENLKTLPPGVEFMNDGDVFLGSLEVIHPGVEFRNGGGVYLGGILGGWLNRWEGNIEGVDDKRLLRLMANKELFL